MAWERRKGRLYFYEATWENGRCVKIYRGTGTAGKAAAEKATAKAERKVLDSIAFMRFAKSLETAEVLFADARELAGDMMEASLLADNCYRASHVWRRRRRP